MKLHTSASVHDINFLEMKNIMIGNKSETIKCAEDKVCRFKSCADIIWNVFSISSPTIYSENKVPQ